MGVLDTNSTTNQAPSFSKEELEWILRVVRESTNLRGVDLQIAVATISNLQKMIKE